jgi:hypothetical protein
MLPQLIFGQSLPAQEATHKSFSLSATIGYMGRLAIGNDGRTGQGHIGVITPDSRYRSNTTGTGLNGGAEVVYTPWRIGFTYSATIRYDHLYSRKNQNGHYNESVKSWLWEHNFGLLRYMRNNKLPLIGKKFKGNPFYYGGSLGILNTGKWYSYMLGDDVINMRLQHSIYGGYIGIPVWKLYIEPGFYYSSNYPFEVPDNFIMYSVRLLYKHRLF